MKTELIQVFEVTKPTMLDWDEIIGTIEAAFKKPLKTSFSTEGVIKIFYTPELHGIAIVKNFCGMVYLDKLAVLKNYRGLGLGNALLTKIFEEFPQLVWRASYHNPYINFYYRHCDGLVKSEHWIVFWKNYSLDNIKEIIEPILEKPSDFQQETGWAEERLRSENECAKKSA